MSENPLAMWHHIAEEYRETVILPDGCRDLILVCPPGEKPYWFVSSLDNQARSVSLKAGSDVSGFRLKPGVRINQADLLGSLPDRPIETGELSSRLDSFTSSKRAVQEALKCLATNAGSVAEVAGIIGVSQRNLQRMLMRETGRPPIFWVMLARVRNTARNLVNRTSLAETADEFGYADQAHMSREFKRWFGASPAAFRQRPDLLVQVCAAGYATT